MSKTKRAQQAQSVSATIIRRTAIAQAITFAFMAGTVQAQTAPSTPAADATKIDAVTVTGIRRGIEAAISIKQNSTSVVEAISAEDIGKLPDSSVAESISRLPGVTAQRDRGTGRAKGISVRGFAGDFAGGLLNGREQASTGDSRGLELDQFPSELLGSIILYKTPDASLVGQGLSGTIDQRTVRPLDFGRRQVGVSLKNISSGRGIEETDAGKGSRLALTYVDQFANRTIGIAGGLTRYKDTGAGQQKFNSWGGWAAEVDYAPGRGGKVKLPGGFTADTESNDFNRDGAMLALQFKPNKNFETSLDLFYSKGSTGSKKTGLEGGIGAISSGPYDPRDDSLIYPRNTLSNIVLTPDGQYAASGTLNNYKGVVRNHIESGDDKLLSVGWNLKYKIGGWTTAADLSSSKVTKVSSRYETTAGLAGNAPTLDTISWSGFNGSNFTDVLYKTGLNYADRNVVRLTDVNGWSGNNDDKLPEAARRASANASPQAGYLAQPTVSDSIKQLRLSAGRDISFWDFNKLDFGVNITDRSKTKTTLEGRLLIKGTDPFGTAPVPGTGTSVAGTTGLPVVSWDPRGSLGTIYDIAAKVDPDILNKDWNVKEKITTFYAMGDLDGKAGSFDYRGNFGLQFINANQSTTGFNVNKQSCTGNTTATCPSKIVSGGTSYTDALPSLNLAFDVAPEQVLRVGFGKVIARPSMGDMRASTGFSYNSTLLNPNRDIGSYSGDSGNPELKPFKATALDISYEKYFGKKGYVSIAGFAKNLDTYILKVARPYDFAPLISGTPQGETVGFLTTPLNGTGGRVTGFEMSVNVPFNLFAPRLDGFGILASYSNTSSTLDLKTAGFATSDVSNPSIPLPGLSREVRNAKIYYEKSGLQVGLAVRSRSNFLGEISDFQDNKQYTFIKAESVVDFQAGYEFQTGPVKGLALSFTGQNLTKAKNQRYNSDPDSPTESIRIGKTFTFGVSYKF